MKKLLLTFLFCMIGFVGVAKDAIHDKAIYCLAEEKWQQSFHKVGERMFLFRDGLVYEIFVTKTDEPNPVSTKGFPYKLNLDSIKFENHMLMRKTLTLYVPTGMVMNCEVFNDGMRGLSPKIHMIIERYKAEAKKNKL